MRFYTENVQHDYCTHKEFPSLFLHARHLLPAADHGKECGSDRYYATASICIISYSVEPRQFNANTAFFHFYEHFHPLTPKQAHLTVNIYSDILTGTMDAFASIISNNVNTIMKRMTSISIILMVPTLIASFYGMNVVNYVEDMPHGFVILVLFSITLSALAFFIFRKIKWF